MGGGGLLEGPDDVIHDLLREDGAVDPALRDNVEPQDAQGRLEANLMAVVRVGGYLIVEVGGVEHAVEEGASGGVDGGVTGGHR